MKAYKGGKKGNSSPNSSPNLLRFMKQVERETGLPVVPNPSEEKYSAMLLALTEPYRPPRMDMEDLRALVELATIAWNLANMKAIVPGVYQTMRAEAKNDFRGEKGAFKLMEEMMQKKEERFAGFDFFIHKAELGVDEKGEAVVTVVAKPFEAFAEEAFDDDEFDGDFDDDEDIDEGQYEPGYINRSAISVNPTPAFYAWLKTVEKEAEEKARDTDALVYLVEEFFNEDELKAWAKKNFRKIFQQELYVHLEDETERPKKLTYKLFEEWFSLRFHTTAFDLEDYPVDK